MINYYSGKISRNDANNGERSLNLEEISEINSKNLKIYGIIIFQNI